MSSTGAWFLGGYRRGMAGTLGESLDLVEIDNLGWTLRSWKYELLYNGLRGALVLDSPAFGDAMETQVRAAQQKFGIREDGVIGPVTAQKLLAKRITDVSAAYAINERDVNGIIRHESSYDVGAIGSVDNADRGPTQQHIYAGGSVNLSQAIRPALAVPRLAAQLARLYKMWDRQSAIASWNVGEGGAEWWYQQGKPSLGSPAWWDEKANGSLAARATAYVDAVFG